MEAYDLLPPQVRAVLREGPQQWDCASVLRRIRRQIRDGNPEHVVIQAAIASIKIAHAREIDQGYCWRTRKPGQAWKNVPKSPHVMANATMQMSTKEGV